MNTKPIINVAYAEDQPVVRAGVIDVMEEDRDIIVLIVAGDGAELLSKIRKSPTLPDVCVLDIGMKGMNGFDTIVELKKHWPDMAVLVFSVFEHEMYILRMIALGAGGYLSKTNCHPATLRDAIRSVAADGIYYSDIASRQFHNSVKNKIVKLPHFTDSEVAVLKLCCTDLSYKEMADKLRTTARSVEGHRDSLFKKLNVNSRVALAIFAVQFGIVPVEINASESKKFKFI